MRILLTGPSGFLGNALARYWAAQGHELWLLARPTSKLQQIENQPSKVRVLRVATVDAVADAVREAAPEAIVHTACAYGRKGETPMDVLESNLRFGTALLQAVLTMPTGITGPISFLNTGTVLEPDVSLYALSKTQFSAWGAMLAVQSSLQLRFIDVRLQQMYGPGDDCSKFTTHVIEACRHNEPCLAMTPGEQQRDFIYIDDVVEAYDRILAHRSDFAVSDVIEVGSGEAITMRSFAELAKQLSGADTTLDFGAVPYRANEAMLCVANTKRLRSLGWQARTTLVEGLRSILDAMAEVPKPSC